MFNSELFKLLRQHPHHHLLINISKLQNSYRLRLTKPAGTLEWLTTDGEKEMILTSEPESGFFKRLYNSLIAPIVPEMLL